MMEVEISSSVCKSGLTPLWELLSSFRVSDPQICPSLSPAPPGTVPTWAGGMFWGGWERMEGSLEGSSLYRRWWAAKSQEAPGDPCPITGSVEGQGFSCLHPQADCHLSGSWSCPSVWLRIKIPGFVKMSCWGWFHRVPGRTTRPLEDFSARPGQTEGKWAGGPLAVHHCPMRQERRPHVWGSCPHPSTCPRASTAQRNLCSWSLWTPTPALRDCYPTMM